MAYDPVNGQVVLFGGYDAAGSYLNETWLFDGTTFWTLDDPTVISQKMKYVHQHELGGAMAWELSGDDAQASLVKAMDRGLQRDDD